jgi:hypothetical protein
MTLIAGWKNIIVARPFYGWWNALGNSLLKKFNSRQEAIKLEKFIKKRGATRFLDDLKVQG